ncbi:helix-turn-helix domain-containing protein, partial [Gardnerella vaginalis]
MVSVNIRALRRSKKITQQELAEALGVSRNS